MQLRLSVWRGIGILFIVVAAVLAFVAAAWTYDDNYQFFAMLSGWSAVASLVFLLVDLGLLARRDAAA